MQLACSLKYWGTHFLALLAHQSGFSQLRALCAEGLSSQRTQTFLVFFGLLDRCPQLFRPGQLYALSLTSQVLARYHEKRTWSVGKRWTACNLNQTSTAPDCRWSPISRSRRPGEEVTPSTLHHQNCFAQIRFLQGPSILFAYGSDSAMLVYHRSLQRMSWLLRPTSRLRILEGLRGLLRRVSCVWVLLKAGQGHLNLNAFSRPCLGCQRSRTRCLTRFHHHSLGFAPPHLLLPDLLSTVWFCRTLWFLLCTSAREGLNQATSCSLLTWEARWFALATLWWRQHTLSLVRSCPPQRTWSAWWFGVGGRSLHWRSPSQQLFPARPMAIVLIIDWK